MSVRNVQKKFIINNFWTIAKDFGPKKRHIIRGSHFYDSQELIFKVLILLLVIL